MKVPLRDRALSFLIAVALHTGAICLGTTLITPAEYSVEAGAGIEVNLVAALPDGHGSEVAVASQPPARLLIQDHENIGEIVERAAQTSVSLHEAAPDQSSSPNRSSVSGDGSSPIHGLHVTTLHVSTGAWTTANTGPVRNPAPRYPESARRQGQQGLVVLRVLVDRTGHPAAIEVQRSSGFPLLDGSAVHAVRQWRFNPARAGSLTIDSAVEIPVRFRLDDHANG